jgi:hypothetical protein
MASHFQADLTFDLRSDIDVLDRQALAFLVDGSGDLPSVLPAHRFFREPDIPMQPLRTGYEKFPDGAVVSMTWVRGMFSTTEEQRQLCLRLPSLRLETLYDSLIYMVDWLATLSATKGFIGTVHEEDSGELVWVLFALDGRLHIAFDPKLEPTAIEW